MRIVLQHQRQQKKQDPSPPQESTTTCEHASPPKNPEPVEDSQPDVWSSSSSTSVHPCEPSPSHHTSTEKETCSVAPTPLEQPRDLKKKKLDHSRASKGKVTFNTDQTKESRKRSRSQSPPVKFTNTSKASSSLTLKPSLPDTSCSTSSCSSSSAGVPSTQDKQRKRKQAALGPALDRKPASKRLESGTHSSVISSSTSSSSNSFSSTRVNRLASRSGTTTSGMVAASGGINSASASAARRPQHPEDVNNGPTVYDGRDAYEDPAYETENPIEVMIRTNRENDRDDEDRENDSSYSSAVQQQQQQQLTTTSVTTSSSSPIRGSRNGETFEAALQKRGLELVEQEGDGNCLFRAVSLQVYGDAGMHGDVRKSCLDFMAKDEAHFSQFLVDENFWDYICRKRENGIHGNNPEIQAISELFNRPVEVFVPENGAEPINIFHEEYKTADVPIRLSYHDGNHYNAVIDPLCPTAGLGLGLPGLEPGLADRLQVEKAKRESDELADKARFEKAMEESHRELMQKAIKESAMESTMSVDHMYKKKTLQMSDLEATDYEMEKAVLASSLESYHNNEQSRKQPWSNRDRRRQHNSSPVTSRNSSRYNDPTFASSSRASWEEPSSISSSSYASAPAAFATSAATTSTAYDHSIRSNESFSRHDGGNSQDEYPESVQELV
eukprot:scaffold121422_cov41-Attheya_sp.AAC.1